MIIFAGWGKLPSLKEGEMVPWKEKHPGGIEREREASRLQEEFLI